MPPEKTPSGCRKINPNAKNISAAIGASGDYLERASALFEAGARILCVDIAHGHHSLMEEALNQLRLKLGDKAILIAGNVATKEGYEYLANAGADAVRVGVGGGSICSTRLQTGHGIPTLQSIIDCANSEIDIPIIADGGIKNSGDAAKSFAAGASFVMLGSVLAGTDETPGDFIRQKNNEKRKVYRGMASREAQQSWRNRVGSVEGVCTTVAAKGPAVEVLRDFEWGIRSAFSYSGASNLREYYHKSKMIRQSPAGIRESGTHILNA